MIFISFQNDLFWIFLRAFAFWCEIIINTIYKAPVCKLNAQFFLWLAAGFPRTGKCSQPIEIIPNNSLAAVPNRVRHSLMSLPMLNSFFHSNGSFLAFGKVASLLVLCSHDILCHAGNKRCTPPMLVVLTSAAWCALQSVKKPPANSP